MTVIRVTINRRTFRISCYAIQLNCAHTVMRMTTPKRLTETIVDDLDLTELPTQADKKSFEDSGLV